MDQLTENRIREIVREEIERLRPQPTVDDVWFTDRVAIYPPPDTTPPNIAR